QGSANPCAPAPRAVCDKFLRFGPGAIVQASDECVRSERRDPDDRPPGRMLERSNSFRRRSIRSAKGDALAVSSHKWPGLRAGAYQGLVRPSRRYLPERPVGGIELGAGDV